MPILYAATDWQRHHSDPTRNNDERSPAEIDRSRIIHCAAFRRLQGKTQVFGVAHDDFFRTRLTHSLEVAQIAKGIALLTGANTDLVEAISLAHDIGHPPFGHAGERTLDECMQEHGFGHFESNAQNLRTLSQLEMKHPDYKGLNLTRATLDGLLKHKRRMSSTAVPLCYPSEQELVAWVIRDAPAPDQISLESQIVDWADQVAYSVHDLEDGIHAQMITAARLSNTNLLEAVYACQGKQLSCTLIDAIFDDLIGVVRTIEAHGNAHYRAAARKQLTSTLIHRFVTSVKIKPLRAGTERGRYTTRITITPIEQGRATVLKQLIQLLIVHDQRVATLERRSRFVIQQLFRALMRPDARDLYPEEFRLFFTEQKDDAGRARIACDYIASMTDHYAEMLYHRLYSPGIGSLFDTL